MKQNKREEGNKKNKHSVKTLKFLFLTIFYLTLAIALSSAARLPVINEDQNNWGTILNEYLDVSHTENGSIKPGLTYNVTDLNGSGTIIFSGLANCNTFDSDGSGKLSCGTDAESSFNSDSMDIVNTTMLGIALSSLDNITLLELFGYFETNISDIDTRAKADNIFLYNDSDTMHFNETALGEEFNQTFTGDENITITKTGNTFTFSFVTSIILTYFRTIFQIEATAYNFGNNLSSDLTKLGNANINTSGSLNVSGDAYFGDNVGIGVANPDFKLEVQIGEDDTGGIKVSDPDSMIATLGDSGSSSERGYLALYDSNVLDAVFRAGTQPSYLKSGKLGIGTTTPNYELDVAGSINATAGNFSILQVKGFDVNFSISLSGYYNTKGQLTTLLDDDYVDVDESPSVADIEGNFGAGLTIVVGAINDDEMNYGTVTLADFTNDPKFVSNNTPVVFTNITIINNNFTMGNIHFFQFNSTCDGWRTGITGGIRLSCDNS